MPPESPLPPRHGLGAAWVRTPDRGSESAEWSTLAQWLRHRLPERVDVERLLADGRFVDATGRGIELHDPYRANFFVWFHRDLRDEPVVPGDLTVLHRDERLVVVDKPPFLASIPRGRHVTQSVVVRLRRELGLPELSPVHRLDRVTSGVLVLTTERRFRGPYQLLFQERQVGKSYRALAPHLADREFPIIVRNHVRKDRGRLQATVVPDAPVNAETVVEVDQIMGENAVYRLTPVTGRTHQLRVHLAGLGAPIVDDPLYPQDLDVAIDDFTRPLQLVAHEVVFTDPFDDRERRFTTRRVLPLAPEGLR